MTKDVNLELVVLVNDDGDPIGSAKKLDIHHSNTPLHLAFSVYIFNDKGQILVTKRASIKKVWPGVWTNSCCGHPMPEEAQIDAIKRRVDYELGMEIDNIKVVLPDYRYKTPAFNSIIENEICPVYIATSSSHPKPNIEEVEDTKWATWQEFNEEALNDTANIWSWWSKDQLNQINSQYTFNESGLEQTSIKPAPSQQ